MKGLDSLDQKILHAIEYIAKSATDLSATLKEKRTTIVYRLRRLEAQRLVHTMRGPRRRVLWRRVLHSDKNTAQVRVFEGDDFSQAPNVLKTLPSGSIIYNIIGTAALRLNFQSNLEDDVIESQRIIKRRKFVIKTIMHEEGLAVTSGLSDALLKAHSGRSFGYKGFVSRSLFRGGAEIMSARSFLLIYNLKDRRSILIKDNEIVTLIHEMMALLFDTLEKATPARVFDFQKHIDTVLAERARIVK